MNNTNPIVDKATLQTMKNMNLNRYQVVYDGRRYKGRDGKLVYITARDAKSAKQIASDLYFLPIKSLLKVFKVPD